MHDLARHAERTLASLDTIRDSLLVLVEKQAIEHFLVVEDVIERLYADMMLLQHSCTMEQMTEAISLTARPIYRVAWSAENDLHPSEMHPHVSFPVIGEIA